MKSHIWCKDNDVFKWEHDGKRFCLHIRDDECAGNPREEWENLCLMACFHRRYNLGDSIEQKTPEEFWQHLVRRIVPVAEVVSALRDGYVAGIRIAENKEDAELFDVYETSYWRTVIGNSDPTERLEYEGVPGAALYDYVENDLTVGNCQKLLEPYCEWMPLWLYDHSGLTMSCGARTGQYADRWDSGCVGWIVAMKDKIMAETTEILYGEDGEPIRVEYKHEGRPSTYGIMSRPLTDATWRKRAIEVMEGEVEVYDQYLRGDVYGYTLYEQEDDEWIEQDSVWGFYGDDLLENGIAGEVGDGFADALKNGTYEQGEAAIRTVTYYDFG